MFNYEESHQVVLTVVYSILLLITLFVYIVFKDKSEKVKRYPIYAIALFIVVCEVFKQIRNIIGYDYNNMIGIIENDKDSFDTFALPFHFCSFFTIFALGSLIFCKNRKIGDFFLNASFIWSSIITLFTFLSPKTIYANYVDSLYTKDYHILIFTLIYHWSVMLYFLISFALRLYKLNIKKIYEMPLCIIIYFMFVIPAAYIFNTNYCQVLDNDLFSFFDPLINKSLLLYQLVLFIIGNIFVSIFYLIFYYLDRHINRTISKKQCIIGISLSVSINFIILLISYLTDFSLLSKIYPFIIFVKDLLIIICILYKEAFKNKKKISN